MNTYQFLFNNGEKIMANGENAKQAFKDTGLEFTDNIIFIRCNPDFNNLEQIPSRIYTNFRFRDKSKNYQSQDYYLNENEIEQLIYKLFPVEAENIFNDVKNGTSVGLDIMRYNFAKSGGEYKYYRPYEVINGEIVKIPNWDL